MLALLVIFSYLMGSIPTGYIIVKKKFNKDIRKFGSGNIGATNVGRIAGKKLSKITAICDMLKAIIPVLVTYLFLYLGLLKSNKSIALALVAISAILGHNYTLFLKFKGGKGVATSAAAFMFSTKGLYCNSNSILWTKVIYKSSIYPFTNCWCYIIFYNLTFWL